MQEILSIRFAYVEVSTMPTSSDSRLFSIEPGNGAITSRAEYSTVYDENYYILSEKYLITHITSWRHNYQIKEICLIAQFLLLLS